MTVAQRAVNDKVLSIASWEPHMLNLHLPMVLPSLALADGDNSSPHQAGIGLTYRPVQHVTVRHLLPRVISPAKTIGYCSSNSYPLEREPILFSFPECTRTLAER
jgi:hypothetical protein